MVVETINFVDKPETYWSAPWRAARPGLRLVERFTRVGPETIDYTFTLEDPLSFTRPWTAAAPMTTDQAARGVTAGEIWEYACHEGNHAMINILGGARAEEAEGRGRQVMTTVQVVAATAVAPDWLHGTAAGCIMGMDPGIGNVGTRGEEDAMSLRGFAVVYAVIAVAVLALSPPAVQAQSESGPRTGWGDPDLQGVWNNATLTPFQRSESMGDQEFFTEEEAASLEGGRRPQRRGCGRRRRARPRRAATSGPTTTSGWSGGRAWCRTGGHPSSPIRRTGGCRR